MTLGTTVGIAILIIGDARSDTGAPGHSHGNFSAGEPGNPKRPAQTILVIMREADGKMLFIPDRVEVRKGDQVRFILRNNGQLEHEFVLATSDENIKHAEEMKKNPRWSMTIRTPGVWLRARRMRSCGALRRRVSSNSAA